MERDRPESGMPAPYPPPRIDARAVFEILVREHADMLAAYLRTLVGADSSFDDIFQEAMLVAWRRLADYDRSRPFAPWLRGIAQVLVLEHVRRKKARPVTTDPLILVEINTRFEELGRGPGDTFAERAERIWLCVAKLPEATREAINLVYVRGMQVGAAAESLGQSKEAVGKRVQRGRQLLAECLGLGDRSDDVQSGQTRPAGG